MTNRLVKFSSHCLHSFGFAFLTLALLAAPEASSSAGRAVAATTAQPANAVIASCPCAMGGGDCGSATYDAAAKKYTCPTNLDCSLSGGCTLKIVDPAAV